MTNYQGQDDTALLMAYQRGDSDAFAVLYARYEAPLYRYFRRQLNNPPADDVFQELWIRVIKASSRFRKEASLKTWIYRIARNMIIDTWRSDARRPATSEDTDLDTLESKTNSPEQFQSGRQQGQRLLAAVSALPFEQREAFLLKEEGGFSLEEIGHITGCGKETVKSRLRYAFNTLKSEVEIL